ncbi:hypothetical protein [Streptomyces lavendulae]|uniref:hypothetical protein n=1 Tax=Streptomyces lavendulae TaxID=1914 RepID=UPI00249F9582|nr:hypothetical protein [Streptomyces lavendulae]GLW04710.1 hypothetical protein Slala05_83400 [Streptomyces lavendulae subsp. lavendulae]
MSDFWDAASAVATTAATGVALWLAVYEVQMRRRDETVRQGAQAHKVLSAIEGTRGKVVNHSSEPLLELRIIRADAEVNGSPVAVRWADDAQRIFGNVSAGEERQLELQVQGWGPLIRAGLEEGIDEGIAPINATDHRLTIQFLDAAGLWWQRVGLRPPTRILGEPAQPAASPE